MNKPPILFFVVVRSTSVLSVRRGQYRGLPTCMQPDGKTVDDQIKCALTGVIIRGNPGHTQLCQYQSQWQNEKRHIQVHILLNTEVIDIINPSDVEWIPTDPQHPGIDDIAQKALAVLLEIQEDDMRVA